jgi:hypothetical protein
MPRLSSVRSSPPRFRLHDEHAGTLPVHRCIVSSSNPSQLSHLWATCPDQHIPWLSSSTSYWSTHSSGPDATPESHVHRELKVCCIVPCCALYLIRHIVVLFRPTHPFSQLGLLLSLANDPLVPTAGPCLLPHFMLAFLLSPHPIPKIQLNLVCGLALLLQQSTIVTSTPLRHIREHDDTAILDLPRLRHKYQLLRQGTDPARRHINRQRLTEVGTVRGSGSGNGNETVNGSGNGNESANENKNESEVVTS